MPATSPWRGVERIRGRLFEGPGFPLLEVPDEDVLASGTSDPLADVDTQACLSAQVGSHIHLPDPESAKAGDWGAVGKLITFDDPAVRLPAIDHLEGFRPGGQSL